MIILRSLFILLLATILFNCSEYPEDTEVLRVNQGTLETQSSTGESAVSISPTDATVQTIIYLRANNSVINEGDILWYINDVGYKSANGARFIGDNLHKGDIVHAVISKDGNEFRSNSIKIKNTPPSIERAGLQPEKPRISSIVKVEADTKDVDNDIITYKYEWSYNGTFAGEESYIESDFKRGDLIEVKVTPFDGEDYGRSIILKSRIFNSLPIVSENEPVFDGKNYTYHVAAKDPDGDMLTYALELGPEGMTIDPKSGVIKWKVGSENEGIHDIKISIDDGNGGRVVVPMTTRISFAAKK